jgi:hypothetical protein
VARRVVGSSPLRGTPSSAVPGAVPGAARRYGTPTSQGQYEYDSVGSAGSNQKRSSTPSKATWKF